MVRSIYNYKYQNYRLFPIYSHHHVIQHFFMTHSWTLYIHEDYISIIDHFYSTKESSFEAETKHILKSKDLEELFKIYLQERQWKTTYLPEGYTFNDFLKEREEKEHERTENQNS